MTDRIQGSSRSFRRTEAHSPEYERARAAQQASKPAPAFKQPGAPAADVWQIIPGPSRPGVTTEFLYLGPENGEPPDAETMARILDAWLALGHAEGHYRISVRPIGGTPWQFAGAVRMHV